MMGKQQLKQLLQFILIWFFVWCFVVFVEEKSFVEFLLKYRWYFLITSVSYFYYYSIQYELDEKSRLLRNAILYGNLYLFLHVFFRPLLNISHELFIVLWLVIWGIYGTTKMKSRRKYLLQIFGWVISFLILISGIIYLYPEKPDIDGFIATKNYQISIFWLTGSVPKNEAYLQIAEWIKSDDFEIVPNFTKTLLEDCKIVYPSRKNNRLEKVVLISPKGDVIWLFPQTEISLDFSGNDLILSEINGKIWFLMSFLDSDVRVYWEKVVLSQEQQNWINGIQDSYWYELVSYLRGQILEDNPYRVDNKIMYNLEKNILNILVKVFPATFSKNLDNLKEYHKYFERFGGWLDDVWDSFLYKMNFSYEWWSFWKNLKNNIMIGKWNVYDVFKVYK